MKTERRHELQQNALADWLGNQGMALKPYAKAIIGGFLLTAALFFAITAMRGNQKKRAARGWNEYFVAASEADIDGLREMAESYRGTEAGAWALQSAGDLGLASGSRAMFINRMEAMDFLNGAREDYESASNLATSEMLQQRALMGLAQTQESLNEFEDAESTYGQVIRRWPESTLAKSAAENLAFLKKPSTREFYDWFSQQNPAANNLTGNPVGGLGIDPPSAYGDLPSDPTTSLPSDSILGGSSLAPPTEGTMDSTPVEDGSSSEGEVKVETETPVETGTSTETPVESTGPTETPVESTGSVIEGAEQVIEGAGQIIEGAGEAVEQAVPVP